MKRGEIWTAAGGEAYTGKPRPVIVIQDDRFADTRSITICPLTTNPAPAAYRVRIEPTLENGLRKPSYAMGDKVSTLPKTRLRERIGRVDERYMSSLNRAVFVFLGLVPYVESIDLIIRTR